MVHKDDLVMTIASDDEISDVEESSDDEGMEEEQELKQAIISKVQWRLCNFDVKALRVSCCVLSIEYRSNSRANRPLRAKEV